MFLLREWIPVLVLAMPSLVPLSLVPLSLVTAASEEGSSGENENSCHLEIEGEAIDNGKGAVPADSVKTISNVPGFAPHVLEVRAVEFGSSVNDQMLALDLLGGHNWIQCRSHLFRLERYATGNVHIDRVKIGDHPRDNRTELAGGNWTDSRPATIGRHVGKSLFCPTVS